MNKLHTMRLYFRDFGIKLIEEIWNHNKLERWENLGEYETDKLSFFLQLSSSHCYHMNPWKMKLKDERIIKIGVLQSNFDNGYYRRKKGNGTFVETKFWEKSKDIPVLANKNSHRAPPFRINIPLSPFLRSGNVLEFTDMILPKFKEGVEKYVKDAIEWRKIKKFAFPPTYLIFWIPSKGDNRVDSKGDFYRRNFITYIEVEVYKNEIGELMGSINCWNRKEKFLKILPMEYKNNPAYFRNIGNTRFIQSW